MIYILGPCSMESWSLYSETAKYLYDVMEDREWWYKASFDKANRSGSGERGPGLSTGLDWIAKLKAEMPRLLITTDVHEPWQVEKLAQVMDTEQDVIQIPAFLCRQTDLLVEAAKNFKLVNIKKGQWVNPENMSLIPQKIGRPCWVTERGRCFGDYLVTDFNIERLKEAFYKVIFDVTHSTQFFREDGSTGGDTNLAKEYFQAAPCFGFDGIFAECHPYPKKAISDQDCQLPLNEVVKLIHQSEAIAKCLA